MSERVSEGAVAAGDTSVATIANCADLRVFKREQLQRAADRRRKKQREPESRNLFLELIYTVVVGVMVRVRHMFLKSCFLRHLQM